MEKYTIYCTVEQTRKALDLGAPLEIGEGKNTVLCKYKNYHTYKRCVIPTAEQMIGWIEEVSRIQIKIERQFHGIEDVEKHRIWVEEDSKPFSPIIKMYTYNSRKEATLAAIDAALEYLEHKQ